MPQIHKQTRITGYIKAILMYTFLIGKNTTPKNHTKKKIKENKATPSSLN
jgi:hypothetical protein